MARVSRETAAAHRTAIVAAAGRLFRQRGFERVGVAEITREAGLTHGGFYGHFASKDALAAEALTAAFAESRALVEAATLEGWVRSYLSRAHRDHPESGCPIPALAADVAQGAEPIRRAFAEGLSTLTAAVAARLDHLGEAERAARAAALVALMVGGLGLARTLVAIDREGSDRLLLTLRVQALALACAA